jgi:hypothetical protein
LKLTFLLIAAYPVLKKNPHKPDNEAHTPAENGGGCCGGYAAFCVPTFSAVGWLKAQSLHFVLSLQRGQTSDGEKIAVIWLMILSIAFGIDKPSAHARRRTVTVPVWENCGVYRVYPLI